MATENRIFNSYNDVGVVAQMLCFRLRRTGLKLIINHYKMSTYVQ